MKKKVTTIKLGYIEGSRGMPFIKIKLEGQQEHRLALIDSGSEITIIDKDTVDSLGPDARLVIKEAKDDIEIDGMGGQKTHKDASYFATFITVTDVTGKIWNVPIDGAVVNLQDLKKAFRIVCPTSEAIMIIGSDMLKALKARINYPRKQIAIRGLFCYDSENSKTN